MRRVTVFSLSLCLCAAWAGGARADDDSPLAVAVESADGRTSARMVRQAVARVLDVEVVSLLDADVERTRGTLAVVVARGGRAARLFFQAKTGRRQLAQVTAPAGEAGASWIAVAVGEFLRASIERSRWALQSEVLDPFEDSGEPRAYRVTSEVIDPWADHDARRRASESPDALGRPRPR